MKITIKKNLYEQIKNSNNKYDKNQIDSKNLYVFVSLFDEIHGTNNKIYIKSYNTTISIYDAIKNILYITTKKYSITTTKQQNQIKNNFVKYNNAKIVYTNEI